MPEKDQLLEVVKRTAQFEKGLSRWVEEIAESSSNLLLHRMKQVASPMGLLSSIIFLRISQIVSRANCKANKALAWQAEQQLALGNMDLFDGMPADRTKFMVSLATRLLCIHHLAMNPEKIY
jgi:hypothetical protein